MPIVFITTTKFHKPLFFSSFFSNKPKSSPPLRIADVLLLQDHEEQSLLLMDACGGLSGSMPRRIAARLFSALKKRRGKVKRIVSDEGKKEDDDVASPDHVTDGPDTTPTENCRMESSFNVGIGCCLLHLLAESKHELQKMTELRIQMETVLQNVKDELRNNDLLLVAKKLGTKDEGSLGFESNQNSDKVLLNHSLKCDDHHVPKEEGDCLEGMDRLEAELEAELERLQLHLDSGKLPTIPPQETIEESSTINSTTSARSFSFSCGEVVDPTIDSEEQDCWGSQSGVPPYELERKLHELLETRQEQQIRELEAALESARQEIREKEREISWWKDTTHLMSRHVKERSRLSFQLGQHSHHLR